MIRKVKMTALMLGLTLALSGLALAHDYDDYYRGNPAQARQYGYDNGFRDGANRGRHEGREHDPYDYQTPDWRQATHGYRNWMGPVQFFQQGYQEGYQQGFRAGFEREDRGWSNGYRYGGGYYEENGYRGRSGYYEDGNRVAQQWGYADGMEAARGDMSLGKPYNPKPRGRFGDRDRGYRREFGNKDVYKAVYSEAYHRGYDDAMRGRGY